MDGFDVLRQLRSDPRTVNLQVLVITAKDMGLRDKAKLRRRLASMVGKREADLDYFTQMVGRLLGSERACAINLDA